MVVGTGMISKAFNSFSNNEKILIFASGVSNSKEDRKEAFQRELNLLNSFVEESKDKKLIYFSTCSIFDDSLKNSKYIQHKKNIENFIKKNYSSYIIFRLPNVIGITNNSNTLFNFFKEKIINQETISVYKYSKRYIIDIDDLTKFLTPLIFSESYNKDIINVCFNNKVYVIDLIENMESLLNIKANKIYLNKGIDYKVKNKEFLSILKKANYKIDKQYNLNVLKNI